MRMLVGFRGLSFLALLLLPVLLPAQDAPAPLPRVLIIGDSISLGYTPTVRAALTNVAVVVHNANPDNAGSTAGGLRHLDAWIGDGNWDVIHFNWGLWDINRRVAGKRNTDGPVATPSDDYAARLEQLVARLKQTRARLIWAQTTYCSGGWGRRRGDEETYNAIASEIMARHGVAINDLHALTRGFAPELFKSPGNVHYTDDGYRSIGEQVVRAIRQALGK